MVDEIGRYLLQEDCNMLRGPMMAISEISGDNTIYSITQTSTAEECPIEPLMCFEYIAAIDSPTPTPSGSGDSVFTGDVEAALGIVGGGLITTLTPYPPSGIVSS